MTSFRKLSVEIGAIPQPDGTTRFLLWAPKFDSVELRLVSSNDQLLPMKRLDRGYWAVSVDSAPAGTRYFFRFDDRHEWPDPASRFQPDGVHGASEVVDPATFGLRAGDWHAPALDQFVIYEAHIGTFTPDETFDSAIGQLDRLKALGITAFEIMPVAEFPGARNWGYDGAYPFAVKSSYGGPAGFARLVDACHQRGMAVILDVVYNHFGPEGAYAARIGNYLTGRYHTPWGSAVNFDGPGSDEVRRFFIESALYWLRDLHVDAFRLDAVHAIFDHSFFPFLQQFTREIHVAARELGRTVHLFAETDLYDPRIVEPTSIGGFGFDAQWSDDLHHALHARLTGETNGYYRDFGSTNEIRRALRDGFVFSARLSRDDGGSRATTPESAHPWQFVVCAQNHDQVGNRAAGDRLTNLLDLEQLKLVAATILLSPFTPLLFMGEEYGEKAPFQYFTSHSDPRLIKSVRRGRKQEFKSFAWSTDVPDPQAPSTFERSKLNPQLRNKRAGKAIESFYQEVIRLRQTLPALQRPDFNRQEVNLLGQEDSIVALRRWHGNDEALILLNFSKTAQEILIPGRDRAWHLLLDSSAVVWGGHTGKSCDCIDSGESLSISGSSLLLFASGARELR